MSDAQRAAALAPVQDAFASLVAMMAGYRGLALYGQGWSDDTGAMFDQEVWMHETSLQLKEVIERRLKEEIQSECPEEK